MAFVVHNLTKRTIVLSDLRAEIGPQKMLDLEKVAERNAIDRSYDLRTALGTKRLRLCSQGVISTSPKPEVHVIEKLVEKHHHHHTEEHHHEKETLDEARILAMMRAIIKENQQSTVVTAGDNKQVLDAVAALQQQIQLLGGSERKSSDVNLMPSIDPAKLAELTSRVVNKMSEGIETGNTKPGRRVILKNTRLSDLADEFD